jgi:NADH-quinone oxidoreductase subunit F
MTDDSIFALYKDEPAPLLPILHAFHDRDGWLTEEAMKAVSAQLRQPLADLYGTVTFYHHFAREAPGQAAPRVCTGNVCCLNGGKELLAELASEGATEMPCSGRCDDMVPVLYGHETRIGKTKSDLKHKPSALPAPNPVGSTECVFQHIRKPGRAMLGGYLATAGFDGLRKALSGTPEELIALITASKLAGRGGAGFPTGLKWKAVREAAGAAKWIVCNADEGEPGCFKDRALMDHDPLALIEGMILAGYAAGAEVGIIYLRYEYPETLRILEAAVAECESAGWLGERVGGSDFSFKLYVRRGAGAYICGEESSLLNSLEGKHPFPRNKPPFPVTHGLYDQPTVINNVETFCAAAHIAEHGAEWYQGLGLKGMAGTKLISLSGDIQRPGNYEVPFGLPLTTLLNEWAGGPKSGRSIQAVTMAGLSGGFLNADAIATATLDEPSIRSFGSFLGAGGIIVFDDTRNMKDMAANAMDFFAHESCGKCFPCRIGTQRLSERLGGQGPSAKDEWLAEVKDIGSVMRSTSACGLGMAAPNVTDSLIKFFPQAVVVGVEPLGEVGS